MTTEPSILLMGPLDQRWSKGRHRAPGVSGTSGGGLTLTCGLRRDAAGRLMDSAGLVIGGPGDEHPLYETDGPLAIVHVEGGMSFGWNWFGPSTGEVAAAIDAASLDPMARAVLIKLDCPGSTIAGFSEVEAAVKRAAERTRVFAIAHEQATSGGYWLGAWAEELAATPTATVGSIGAISILWDDSGYGEQLGIKCIPIATGKLKLEGLAPAGVSEEVKAAVAARLTAVYDRFAAAVTAGRGVSRAEIDALDAGVLYGPEALAAGLVDRVVEYADYVQELKDTLSPRGLRGGVFAKGLTMADKNPIVIANLSDLAGFVSAEAMATIQNQVIESALARGSVVKPENAAAAATFDQLDGVFGQSGDEGAAHITASLKARHSLSQAQAAWAKKQDETIAALRKEVAELNTKLEEIKKLPGGRPPLATGPSGTQGAAGGGDVKTFADAVKAAAAEKNLDLKSRDINKGLPAAMFKAAKDHPALHAEWKRQGCPALT